jgi:hypothetical protein
LEFDMTASAHGLADAYVTMLNEHDPDLVDRFVADPARVETEYMASSAFAADMAGFDPHDIVDVTSVLLDSTASSPIR